MNAFETTYTPEAVRMAPESEALFRVALDLIHRREQTVHEQLLPDYDRDAERSLQQTAEAQAAEDARDAFLKDDVNAGAEPNWLHAQPGSQEKYDLAG